LTHCTGAVTKEECQRWLDLMLWHIR